MEDIDELNLLKVPPTKITNITQGEKKFIQINI